MTEAPATAPTARAPVGGVAATPTEARNRFMLRARDVMDRRFATDLDVRALARLACMSDAHFIRTFKDVFAETPHRYLQRRRVERAMYLLREHQRSVTDICFDVGFNSLGTFSRTFKEIVGVSPTTYRDGTSAAAVPSCFITAWTRPSSFGEARRPPGLYSGSTAAPPSAADTREAEEPA